MATTNLTGTWTYFRSEDGAVFRRDRWLIELLSAEHGWVDYPKAFDWFYDAGYMTAISEQEARAIAEKDGLAWPTT